MSDYCSPHKLNVNPKTLPTCLKRTQTPQGAVLWGNPITLMSFRKLIHVCKFCLFMCVFYAQRSFMWLLARQTCWKPFPRKRRRSRAGRSHHLDLAQKCYRQRCNNYICIQAFIGIARKDLVTWRPMFSTGNRTGVGFYTSTCYLFILVPLNVRLYR